MKKLFTCLLLVTVLLAGMSTVALASEITVEVNGTAVAFSDAQPFIDDNGRTLVPLRAIADALGMEVRFEDETREAIFTKTYTAETTRESNETSYVCQDVIVFTIDSNEATHTTTWYALPVTEAPDAEGEEGEDAEAPAEDADAKGEEDAETPAEDADAEGEDGEEEDADAPAEEPEVDPNIVKQDTVKIEMNAAAVIVEGRTLAPVRYLAEAVGYKVGWDGPTRVVSIVVDAEEEAEAPAADVEGADGEEAADGEAADGDAEGEGEGEDGEEGDKEGTEA